MDVLEDSEHSVFQKYDYNVILSFSAEGNHQAFTDHLYKALVETGIRIRTFKDSGDIWRIRDLKPNFIIILSKNYISSRWCLDELVRILEFRRDFGCVVVPFFYDVDQYHIAEAFSNYEEENEEIWVRNKMMGKLEEWRKALREAACLPGMDLQNESNWYKPAETIAESSNQKLSDSKKMPQVEEWNATEINLMNSELSQLPENPNCTGLLVLHLQQNSDLTVIPPRFFQMMPVLQVLDLSYTSIKSLPPSISSLVELRELLLRRCELLMELPPEIGALRSLKVLDLEGAQLVCLPKEIGCLLKLERLKVSFNRCADQYTESKGIRRIIPRKTLSKFSRLYELSIHLDPDCGWWEVEVEDIINQLPMLENLKTVKLYLPTVGLLKKFLQRQYKMLAWLPPIGPLIYPTLLNFKLIVGSQEPHLMPCLPRDLQDKFETLEKCLKYVNGEGNFDIGVIGKALKHANALFLERHWTIERLSQFKADEMDQLRFCLLVECNEIDTIVNGGDFYQQEDNGFGEKPVLGSLEYLSVHYMKNLGSIWRGKIVTGCLLCLQVLALHTCPELSTIFNLELLPNLIKLKELIVDDCPKLASLVSVESSNLQSDHEFLPSLEKISLLHLPELSSISSGSRIAPNLKRMVIYNCPELKDLSPMQTFNKDMEEIIGEREWSEEINNKPDYFDHIFVPLNREGDLMDQLAEARNSLNPLCMVLNSIENQNLQLQLERAAHETSSGVNDWKDKMEGILNFLKNDVGILPGPCSVPVLPGLIVGLDMQLEELKGMLLEDKVSVVVLSAPGGCGKTTLAKLLYHDEQIRAIFGDIFFVTVSADLTVIVQKLFQQKSRQPPRFETAHEAINKFEEFLRKTGSHPILVVLDDVWYGGEFLIRSFMLKMPGYKLLVTSRFVFPELSPTYKMNTLNDQDAMTLFQHSAFPQGGISDMPADLVYEIVRGCNGFPLKLTEVGRSLCGEPESRWRSVLKSFHNDLSGQTTLDALDEMPILKEFCLDLGSFPQDQKIPPTALMDMWIEWYNLDEEGKHKTFDPLLDLSSRNVVDIASIRRHASEVVTEHFVTQSASLRELAIGQSSQEPIEQRKRLIMEIRGNDLPKWCIEQNKRSLPARLLSITTDETFSSNWYETHQYMYLPDVEVALLNFSTQNYTLPPFMESMRQLKVLIVTNNGSSLAELNDFKLIHHLPSLRRLRLEYISISSLGLLEMRVLTGKLSLCRCNVREAFESSSRGIFSPYIGEIEIDYCDDLVQLPAGICSLHNLKRLSITSCHELQALPKDLGLLKELESLTLRSCTKLSGLPLSVGRLRNLRFLDISGCVNLTYFPVEMGLLRTVKKLNIQGCKRLTRFRLVDLGKLEELVCSEENSHLFEYSQNLSPKLKIKKV